MIPEQVLERAADLIEERGWHQGDYVGPDGCLCIVGAIDLVLTDGESPLPPSIWDERAVKQFQDVLCVARERIRQTRADVWRTLGDAPPVSCWNDEEGRTAEEVIAVLRGSRQPDPAGAAPLD